MTAISKYIQYSTDDILDALPENYPLYKDSGLWQIRSDDMESVIFQQRHFDSFRYFIIRYLYFLEEIDPETSRQVNFNLACKNSFSVNDYELN